jgi:hypothetical protein
MAPCGAKLFHGAFGAGLSCRSAEGGTHASHGNLQWGIAAAPLEDIAVRDVVEYADEQHRSRIDQPEDRCDLRKGRHRHNYDSNPEKNLDFAILARAEHRQGMSLPWRDPGYRSEQGEVKRFENSGKEHGVVGNRADDVTRVLQERRWFAVAQAGYAVQARDTVQQPPDHELETDGHGCRRDGPHPDPGSNELRQG